ncbi:hypothetical protein [Inhella gelatinilytica]|uniref:Uncharacterized protein n=1 Tax=Inhella gelatinilytica TaxID=2795030 RepID=A0A931IXE3_9BURK|nr:hypothetical protein [Inhella gelatinilytica]MBH9553331.1 hypothetical protein [Inhella gelatinilytica]
MEAQALALSDDERGLLGYLLWAYPDTGALHFKELALASGWPYGAVIAGLTRLQAAGLVRRTQGCWEPVPALWRELRVPQDALRSRSTPFA